MKKLIFLILLFTGIVFSQTPSYQNVSYDSAATSSDSLKLARGLQLGGLLVAIGYIPQTQLFTKRLDVKNGYIVHKKHTMTNIPGIFAAGDVVDFRYRQAITAAAEGCQAALDAEKWLQDSNEF